MKRTIDESNSLADINNTLFHRISPKKDCFKIDKAYFFAPPTNQVKSFLCRKSLASVMQSKIPKIYYLLLDQPFPIELDRALALSAALVPVGRGVREPSKCIGLLQKKDQPVYLISFPPHFPYI